MQERTPEPKPLELAALIPNFVPDAELDAVAVKVEELSRYRVAAVMDDAESLKNKVAKLESEVAALLEHCGLAFDAYLDPYIDLAEQFKKNKRLEPSPARLSDIERARLVAARSRMA